MFHPLAYTKTFALVGVALLSITLVPALIPIFLKGRIKSEDENWLVRTMIEIFKPMLSWLMDRTTLVCWLFVVILGLGYVASTKLGREFMPDLDEESDHGHADHRAPRLGRPRRRDDLRVRDEVLRGFPEVWQVVGKAGRAETPTDPSPLDMIETVINLRDRELWPKRKLRFEDAAGPDAGRARRPGGARACSQPPASADEREGLVNEAAMTVASRVDETLRDLAVRRLDGVPPRAGPRPGRRGGRRPARPGRARRPSPASRPPAEREALVEAAGEDLRRPARVRGPARRRDASWSSDAARRLVALGVLRDRPDLLTPAAAPLERAAEAAGDVLGFARPTLFTPDRRAARRRARATAQGADQDAQLGAVRPRRRRRHLGGPRRADRSSAASAKLARARGRRRRSSQALRAALDKPFADRLLLWKKTKNDLVEEMSTALQMPGWGNSFTQPIANRIEMLSTGVRLPVAVKVFGADLDEIQRVSQEIAAVLRGVRGRGRRLPRPDHRQGLRRDQDRPQEGGPLRHQRRRHPGRRRGGDGGPAADDDRRGPRALPGPRPLRPRLPRRRRGAQAHPRLGARRWPPRPAAGGGMGMGGDGAAGPAAPRRPRPVQVPLAAVADVRVVEGPSMIKSENGLLRAYIQLHVRDRDEVGFVEEAQAGRGREGQAPRRACTSSGRASSSTRSGRSKTLRIVFPAVIAVIVLILYLTHKSWIDAAADDDQRPRAPWPAGRSSSGSSASTSAWRSRSATSPASAWRSRPGVVMLVYLREAIDERGGPGADRLDRRAAAGDPRRGRSTGSGPSS